MKAKITKVSNKYLVKSIFEYLTLETCLKIIRFNKKLHDQLGLDIDTYNEFYKLKMAFKPKYEYIEKYIDFFYDEKQTKYDNKRLIGNNSFFKDIKLYYNGINSIQDNILIDISKHKKWKIFVENINNIKLEINPSIIQYINNLNIKDKNDTLKHLKKHRNCIKEIYFNSFKGKNEINFSMRKNINMILNSIFKTMSSDYCFVKKISFKDNSIISVLDINNILLEISDIIYNNATHLTIEQLYIDSFSIFNSIENINFYIKEKLYNLKKIELYGFNFINDNGKNSSLLCKLFTKLNYLEKVDLSGSSCDNKNLNIIFGNNKNLKIKELKFEIYYGDKLVEWNFLKLFINTLEVLEIKMVFPYILKTISDKILFNYNNNNIQSLMSLINKMKKLQKLKLFGNYLNYYDLNYLNNNKIKDLVYEFQIKKTCKKNPSDLNKTFCNFNELKSISLICNDVNIDSKDDIEKKYKSIIFKFPENLSILKFSNFTEKNFLKSYLIPLINANKDKFLKIKELKLDDCFLDKIYFKQFLSAIPLSDNMLKLSFNKCYNEFKLKDLMQFIPTIFEVAPELIELELSNIKFKEEMLSNPEFLKLRLLFPDNLINFNLIDNQNLIPKSMLEYLKTYFGLFLNYEIK